MWRATVWRGGFPSSNELHGQISDSGRYTTDKTPTAWCSVYVPGIQIKRNQPPNLRETGHIHRQINNARGVNGEWQRCENSTPGGEGEFYLSHLSLGLRHLKNTCDKMTTCRPIQSRVYMDKLGYYQYIFYYLLVVIKTAGGY